MYVCGRERESFCEDRIGGDAWKWPNSGYRLASVHSRKRATTCLGWELPHAAQRRGPNQTEEHIGLEKYGVSG